MNNFLLWSSLKMSTSFNSRKFIFHYAFVGLPLLLFFSVLDNFFYFYMCTHQGTGKDSCMKVTISCVQYIFSRKVLLKVFSAVQCCSMHVYNSYFCMSLNRNMFPANLVQATFQQVRIHR